MATPRMTPNRYEGLICNQHPEFSGVRMRSNNKCVQCLYLSSLLKIKKYRSVLANVAAESKSAKKYRQNRLSDYRLNMHNYRARKSGRGQLSRGLFGELFIAQKSVCGCGCGRPLGPESHMDHWLPLVLGGLNVDSNIRLLTPFCNLSKGGKHPDSFIMSRRMK